MAAIAGMTSSSAFVRCCGAIPSSLTDVIVYTFEISKRVFTDATNQPRARQAELEWPSAVP